MRMIDVCSLITIYMAKEMWEEPCLLSIINDLIVSEMVLFPCFPFVKGYYQKYN